MFFSLDILPWFFALLGVIGAAGAALFFKEKPTPTRSGYTIIEEIA